MNIAIPKILKIMQGVEKLATDSARNTDKAFYKTMQLITNGEGKEILSYQGDCIKNLPEYIQKLAIGLKDPQILIGTKSMNQGQGIIGLAVKDSNITKMKFAINIDNVHQTLPIFQVKGKANSEIGNIIGMDIFYNSNVTFTPENFINSLTQRGTSSINATFMEGKSLGMALEVYYNQKLAKMSALFSGIADKLKISTIKQQLSKTSSKELNKTQKEIAELLSNKGIRTDNIIQHLDLITQYASKSGKITKEQLIECFNEVIKEMGHNPKHFNITWVKDSSSVGGEFKLVSGNILLNKTLLNMSNQDAIIVLFHEMTHAFDYLKLYKKLGKEHFCKLLEPVVREEGMAINCEWYEKVSKYMDISDFDANAFIRDMKRKNNIDKTIFSDLQRELTGRTAYQISEAEQSARQTECYIIGNLHSKGKLRKTRHSNEFGHGPFDELMLHEGTNRTYMEEINKKLKIYGKNAGKKFDKLFYDCLTGVDKTEWQLYNRYQACDITKTKGMQLFCDRIDARKRLSELHKKLYNEGLNNQEIEEYDKLVKQIYHSEKQLISEVLGSMLTKLENKNNV